MNDYIGITKERDYSLDAAKGLLILFVVYAHCYTEGILHDFFFSFHMPAFFIISGITWKLSGCFVQPFKVDVIKILCSIGIPFIFFELLGILQDIIRNGLIQSWKGFLYNALTLQCNNIVDWFLGTLLLAKLLSMAIFYPLKKVFPINSANLIYLSVSVIGMIVSLFLPYSSLFTRIIERTIIANGFISIGVVKKTLFTHNKINAGLFALSIAFILSLTNSAYVDMYELHFGVPVVFLSTALLGTFGIIQLSKLSTVKLFIWCGQNSLIIMGTHIPILLIFRHIFNTTSPTNIHRICDIIVILLLQIPIVYIVRFLHLTIAHIFKQK